MFAIDREQVSAWAEALGGNRQLLDRLRAERGWDERVLRELQVGFDGERITVPSADEHARPQGLLRLRIDPSQRSKVLAVPGTRLALIPRLAPEQTRIWLVEGPSDMLAARCAGLPAIAVPGTHAWRTEWANDLVGRRVTMVMDDELGNAVPLPNLAEIASTAASHNIQLISIFHDIAQARTRYRDQALTVINNHRARMLLSGVADMETLKYFSELVGDEEVKDRTDPDAPVRRRPLAPPDQLRQIKPEHGLLVYGSLRPAQLRLRLYFNDRKLKQAA